MCCVLENYDVLENFYSVGKGGKLLGDHADGLSRRVPKQDPVRPCCAKLGGVHSRGKGKSLLDSSLLPVRAVLEYALSCSALLWKSAKKIQSGTSKAFLLWRKATKQIAWVSGN